MNHRGSDPTLAATRVCLVVLTQASVATEPGEGTLDDPALCEYDEAALPLQFGHDLERETKFVCAPVLELTLVAGIGPDGLESGIAVPVELGEDLLGSITILYVGLVNRKSMNQPEGIDRNVALSAAYLLAGIVAPGPPFSVVFTDWLSRTAALGEGSWPSARRSSSRSASWTRSKVPFRRQRRKWNQPVVQGGKSWGNMRHEQPALA